MMSRILALGLLIAAGAAQAGSPTTTQRAVILAPIPASRTIAVTPPTSGSPAATRALEEGLRAAGFTVVARSAHPAMLATYEVVGDASLTTSQPLLRLQGTQNTTDFSSVRDNAYRQVLVGAWDAAASPQPTASSMIWTAELASSGLSSDQRQFLPGMLRAGASAYGHDVRRPS